MYVVSMELENPLNCHSLVGGQRWRDHLIFYVYLNFRTAIIPTKVPYNLRYYTDYMSRILGVNQLPLYYPTQAMH